MITSMIDGKPAEFVNGSWRFCDNRQSLTEYVSACKHCGKFESSFSVQLIFSDEQWKETFPQVDGVLCPECIIKRMKKMGVKYAHVSWSEDE